jgi:hypothetical protein
MSRRSVPILLATVLLLAASVPAHADLYKWVDERGVVNYGDRPPPQARRLRPLELDLDSAAVIPGIPKEELQQLRERDAERRLRQLEAEVDELRAREAARGAAPAAEPAEARTYWYPVYGHPAYGYRRKPEPRPDAGWTPRPTHPIARPLPDRRFTRQNGPTPPSGRHKHGPTHESFIPSKR